MHMRGELLEARPHRLPNPRNLPGVRFGTELQGDEMTRDILGMYEKVLAEAGKQGRKIDTDTLRMAFLMKANIIREDTQDRHMEAMEKMGLIRRMEDKIEILSQSRV